MVSPSFTASIKGKTSVLGEVKANLIFQQLRSFLNHAMIKKNATRKSNLKTGSLALMHI